MGRRVIVAGGGAAGLAAAVTAARNGVETVLLEHGNRLGKKLLSTGNGKCNLTNYDMKPEAFYGDQEFAWKVIGRYPVKDTLAFFESLGLVMKDRNGYIYPNSGQASSVLDALRFELEHLGVEVECNCEILKIEKDLTVRTSLGTRKGDAVILAAGSKAAPGTGSDGSGYQLAKSLGHRIIKPLPALVQLRGQEKWLKTAAGVRAEGVVSLLIDGKKTADERGEIQFTDYGISGIPVFQISRFASRALDEKKNVTAKLDLLPEMERPELDRFFKNRVKQQGYLPAEEFLNGVLNKKLGTVLLKTADIRPGSRASGLTEGQLYRLADAVKGLVVHVTATNPFEQAQVCCGGVDTREIDPATMESKLVKGLYMAGEILDVDGICGGYNLQWAWSSGFLAGMSAGRGNQC